MKNIGIHIIISSFFVFLSADPLLGQEKVIEGMVTTFDSIPLINASIQVKSSKEVVYTDSLGFFSVSCLPEDKLKISANGFTKLNVRVKEESLFVFANLKLSPKPESRDLAVGYGHVKDANKLYAISSVNEKDLDFSYYSDIYDIIMEKFPSVQIQGDGELVIRGTQTMASSNAALLIVDGREVSTFVFSNLSPTDIASINVLKDASASVYGSRGGNGVVIVETKRGGDR
jgi:TonB-dependent SusC/RagA subfamily outer membrane receptor